MSRSTLHIMGISGSLRKKSSNTNLLHAISQRAPEEIKITIYEGIGDLPHFNPELDEEPPASVTLFREQVKSADGIIISTPEYAHGVPGVMKNALDWLVSSGEFVYKPVVVISASPMETGGEKAHDSILLTLRMMTAHIVKGGTFKIPFVNKKISADAQITDESLGRELDDMLLRLEQAVYQQAENGINPIHE